MPCPSFETLSTYADQALPSALQQRLEQHLAGCAMCQQELEKLQQLHAMVQALPAPAMGFDLAARLPDLLPPAAAPGPHRQRHWGWVSAGASVGALACGVWLGGLLLAGHSAPPAARNGITRVLGPIPPGGLCAAVELCTLSKGMP